MVKMVREGEEGGKKGGREGGKGRERMGGRGSPPSVITFNGTAAMPGIPAVGDESLRGCDFGAWVVRCDFAALW